MIILGIETSCDETAVAILEEKNGTFSVLSNVVSSQISLHSAWGGVVPNLAAREHLKNIIPVIQEGLDLAKITPQKIDLISVTNGPGLIPALLIGTGTAKTLSYLWEKPLLGIHHIEGHIYANFIKNEIGVISNFQFPISNKNLKSKFQKTKKEPSSLNENCELKIENSLNIKFPILCLVVSGGHTQLVLMKKHLNYEIIGETLDDAAGEAFDKVARILNLGYPGGPAISALAEIATDQHRLSTDLRGKIQHKSVLSPHKSVILPRPMLKSKDFNFSFSGLKTAVLYLVKKNEEKLQDEKFVSTVCQEFQQAVCDVLISKTIAAAKKYNPKTILLAGGVSANTELRKQLGKAIETNFENINYQIPDIKYCIDNASMIAVAGFFRWRENENKKSFQKELKNNWQNLKTDANLKLK